MADYCARKGCGHTLRIHETYAGGQYTGNAKSACNQPGCDCERYKPWWRFW